MHHLLRIPLGGTDCMWLDHSSIRRVDGLSIKSSVSCMKLLLDVTRFVGMGVAIWWMSSIVHSPPPLSLLAADMSVIIQYFPQMKIIDICHCGILPFMLKKNVCFISKVLFSYVDRQ